MLSRVGLYHPTVLSREPYLWLDVVVTVVAMVRGLRYERIQKEQGQSRRKGREGRVLYR